MMRLLLIPAFIFCSLLRLAAQIPTGYYDNANGLTGAALKQALHDIIDNHNSVSYASLLTHFQTTDVKPNGKVWDIYSDKPGQTPAYEYNFGNNCGNYAAEGDCWNREHSWPQSWFNSLAPAQSDMFHLYPTDGYVNGRRSNWPFSEVNSPTWTSTNGSKLGASVFPGYTGTAFEPIDEYKGDLARSYFYMAVRYYTEDGGWSNSAMATKSQLTQWAVNLLLKWHNEDPVSQKEIDRNNDIYGIQNNRNPFIDHPEWAELIWNSTVGMSEDQSIAFFNVYPNPSASGIYHLNVSTTGKEVEVYVQTITGQVVFSESTSSAEMIISLEDEPAGVYIMKVVSGESVSGKLLIRN